MIPLRNFRRSRAGAYSRSVAVGATLRGGALTIGGVRATRRADSLRVPRAKRAKASRDNGRQPPWRGGERRTNERANERTAGGRTDGRTDGRARRTARDRERQEAKERERERKRQRKRDKGGEELTLKIIRRASWRDEFSLRLLMHRLTAASSVAKRRLQARRLNNFARARARN